MELIANALGHFAVDDDGHRIIGRGNIGNGYQRRNAQFGRVLILDKALDRGQELSDAAGLVDHGRQAAGQHGQEEDIGHA